MATISPQYKYENMNLTFYRAFEEKFRGSRPDIMSRMEIYLPFIMPLLSIYPEAKAVDLGCGRGEWLELLKHNGFSAYGVDLNEEMLEPAKQIGLPVIKDEAIGFLKKLPDESHIVISAFHFVEHIPFDEVEILVQEALRVLAPGGILILETPNPENIVVGTTNFYLDPTHKHPIPPQLLAFLPEHYGFEKFKLLRLQENDKLADETKPGLLDVFRGVSPDCAIVAQKFAGNEILQLSHDAFAKDYGLTLDRLATNYDTHIKSLINEICTLSKLLRDSDLDRDERTKEINMITAKLKNSEAARNEQGMHIEALATLLKESEAGINRIEALKTIAVDLTPILPGGENGGAKIFVLELIKQLAELVPTTEFILLTQEASHNELKALERKNVRCIMVLASKTTASPLFNLVRSAIRNLPYLGRRLGALGYRASVLLKRRQALSLLKNIKANLLFCPFTAPTYHEPGIPTVCTIYDLQYKTYPEFFNPEEVIHRNYTFTEACRRGSMLTAISEYSRQSAIKHGIIEPEKIRTIYLQMAQRIVSDRDQNNEILQRLHLETEQYLVYPANFWKHKNHEILLSAFGIACQGNLPANIKLVCTGAEGDRHSWLQEAAAVMNLGERVLFPGFLTNEELSSLISNSKAILFPSLYEGFGLPVIEAMAAGIPVACSNVTSLPEVSADAALLFNPRIPTEIAEAITTICTDKELRERLIAAGKERARIFSDSKMMAKKYWVLFQDAIEKNQQRDELTGAYQDGWVGSQINIQIAPSTNQQSLEIEFFAPDWIPQSKIIVKATQSGITEGKPIEILPGARGALSMPLPENGGCYEIRINPTFVPSKLNGSDEDQRELSLMIQKCSVIRNNGQSIELISGMKSA